MSGAFSSVFYDGISTLIDDVPRSAYSGVSDPGPFWPALIGSQAAAAGKLLREEVCWRALECAEKLNSSISVLNHSLKLWKPTQVGRSLKILMFL